jgi:hypothetical protein
MTPSQTWKRFEVTEFSMNSAETRYNLGIVALSGVLIKAMSYRKFNLHEVKLGSAVQTFVLVRATTGAAIII